MWVNSRLVSFWTRASAISSKTAPGGDSQKALTNLRECKISHDDKGSSGNRSNETWQSEGIFVPEGCLEQRKMTRRMCQ